MSDVSERQSFSDFPVHISDKLKDIDGKSCHAWIGHAQFSPFRYINYLRYLERDKTPQRVQEANRKRANLKIVQIIVPEISSPLKRLAIMCARALRVIARGEEAVVYHGISYQFVCTHPCGVT